LGKLEGVGRGFREGRERDQGGHDRCTKTARPQSSAGLDEGGTSKKKALRTT